jgi:flagellar M-ring protein FliF
VKKAVGYSEERGDQIQVLNVAFDTSAADEGAQGGEAAPLGNPMLGQYIRYGLFGLLAMLIVLFIVRPVIRVLSTASQFPPGTLPATVGQLEAALGSSQAAALEMARTNPQATALVVQKWMKEK